MSSQSAIDVTGLRRTFESGRRSNRKTNVAVDGITFSVDPGERLAFIGPNGAGKSTSIKMLTGILHPTAGDALVLGMVPWRERRALARRIGTLFGQRSLLWAELAPRRSLVMLGAIFGIDQDVLARRIDELGAVLEATELLDQPVRGLSLGQRMRCELAACMLHEPELLFLDEPTIGLDLLAKQLFRDLLVRLNTELGTTVFLTSHDVADIESVAERAIVVNHGRIIYDDAVGAMRRELLSTKLVEIGLAGPADETLLSDFGAGVRVVAHSETVVRLEVDTTVEAIADLVPLLLHRLPVADLSVVDPPLEQVIGEIYARPA